MQVKTILEEGLKREYEITIPAERIKQAEDTRLKQVARKFRIEGFRPGKAPLDLVRKHKKGEITAHVLQQIIEESSKEFVKEKGFELSKDADISLKSYDDGKEMQYSIKLDIMPEVPEIDISGVSISKPVAKISDKDVDEVLENMQAENPKYEDAKDARPLADGDIAVIDFVGSIDGVEFPGGAAQGHELKIGSGQFIPGFEEQLIGMNKGDKKDINVPFPEEYHAKDLAGKDSIFAVTLHEVKEATKQEINDEFAERMGYDDLSSMRELITTDMQREVDEACKAHAKKNLFDILDKNYDFNIPQHMLEGELASVKKQIETAKQKGDDETISGKNDAELEEEASKISLRRVKLGIILSDYGRKKEVDVSPQELEEAIWKAAASYGTAEEQFVEFFRKNPERAKMFVGPILEDKVVDLLLEQVDIKEQQVTVEELRKMEISLDNEAGSDGESNSSSAPKDEEAA